MRFRVRGCQYVNDDYAKVERRRDFRSRYIKKTKLICKISFETKYIYSSMFTIETVEREI